jgi:outer membrane lipoprotein-sorting protein
MLTQNSSIPGPTGKSATSPSRQSRAVPTSLAGIFLFFLIMALSTNLRAAQSPTEQALADIERMKAAYARVAGYQTEMEVSEYSGGEVIEKKRFLYTFKKPDHMRIDMESPYPGMILIYPDKDGKVFVKPAGWVGIMKLHLSPDSGLLKSRTGQRLDQTHLGLLIVNIARSLTDWRRGEIKVSTAPDRVLIEVLAQDHFLAGVLTQYRFAIDTRCWLPVGIEEFTPAGILKRKVFIRNLSTSIIVSDRFFSTEGE